MEKDVCEYCHTPLNGKKKLVTVYRHRQGEHYIFEQVPATVCPRCGERYFAAPVAREMDQLMKQPKPLARLVQVPVIALKTVV